MTTEQLEVRVGVSGGTLDDQALSECAEQLIAELSELDVDEVTAATEGDAPPGSKGLDLVALGALVVKLARSRKRLMQLVDGLKDWLTRNDVGSVRVEIDGDVLELSHATSPERKVLIDSWVARHAEA